MMNNVLTKRQLLNLMRFWQRRLYLNDWEIVLKLVDDMPENTQGNANWSLSNEQAIIKIITLAGFKKLQTPFPYQPEVILVHELLHLHFAPLQVPAMDDEDKADPRSIAQERAIDHIAKALVYTRQAAKNNRKRGYARGL